MLFTLMASLGVAVTVAVTVLLVMMMPSKVTGSNRGDGVRCSSSCLLDLQQPIQIRVVLF